MSKADISSGGETVLDAAYRMLRHRERSMNEVSERLEAAGFADSEREDAIETLIRTGLLDDARFAELRARSLVERGAGDARIRHELRRAGIASESIEDALETVEPEADRAQSVVLRRGPGLKTARFLHGKGFSEEIVAGVVAGGDGDELG